MCLRSHGQSERRASADHLAHLKGDRLLTCAHLRSIAPAIPLLLLLCTQTCALPPSCRVSALRFRVAAIAAANKHTLALADGGAVFSWGGNGQGQLGYGTSDSAANATPRLVEAMKVRSHRVSSVLALAVTFNKTLRCTPWNLWTSG